MGHPMSKHPGPTQPGLHLSGQDADGLGSVEAWREVGYRLRGLALALTRNHDRADELVQHTLATLLARAPGRADHLGYARTVLLRRWLDEQRTLRRRAARWVRLAAGAARWSAARVADDHSALHEAVDALPARQRAALVLRVVEGLEYPQIAEVLGCSVEAVRSNLHLARAGVRRRMGGEP